MKLRFLPDLLNFWPRTAAARRRQHRRKKITGSPLRLEALEDRTLLDTVRWISPNSGSWGDADNWSTGSVPGAADDVFIDVPQNITVTHSIGAHSIRSLTSQKALNLSGGSLS